MTFGGLLGALFGPLAELIEFVVSWVPRYMIVQTNERGVLYPRGQEARELLPGIRWYVPALCEVVKHHVCEQVLDVGAITIETSDGRPVSAGAVCTYRIVDVIAYEVNVLDADEGMSEVAEGAVRKLVVQSKIDQLRDHRKPLDDRLATKLEEVLKRFGVEILTARLTDLAECQAVYRLFGVSHELHLGLGGD